MTALGARALALACVVPALLVVSCGGDDTPEPTSGPCPSRLVIQTDWMPQVEHGGTYQLIGDDGTIDASTFRYSGAVSDDYAVAGVSEVEIRAGASAISFAPVASELYKSDEIHLAFLGATDAMRQWAETPVIGVAKTLENDPRVLIWDPTRFDIDRPEDLKSSGARVHHFPRISFVKWLIGEGWMDESQSDDTFDGSFREWLLTEGGIVQQGYVTNEVWQLENTIDWSAGAPAPVDYALLSDWGFRNYPSMYVVRADRLGELGSCLEELVPALSRAWVDFLADPDEVVGLLETINLEYAYWETPVELSRAALDKIDQLGLATNSSDGTYCSFDTERIGELAGIMQSVLAGAIDAPPTATEMAQVVDNRFCEGAPGRD